jgi:2-polyprenyl-6-methoxyphenol hydroxylase-like FAD-dependent oxidoreductase
MTEKTSVVVVGAGPCGLAAACELRRRGIPVRLLEADP